MEPPHAHVPRGRPVPHRSLTLAATTAALALVLTSSGDAFLVAVLVGLATADRLVAGVTALVALSVLARWGTSSMSALAGLQAVLGPAGATGETIGVASSWLGAAALLATASGVSGRWPAAVLGALAGLLVAGPAIAGPEDGAVRLAGAVAGMALTVLAAGRIRGRLAMPAAALLAAIATGLAVLA